MQKRKTNKQKRPKKKSKTKTNLPVKNLSSIPPSQVLAISVCASIGSGYFTKMETHNGEHLESLAYDAFEIPNFVACISTSCLIMDE